MTECESCGADEELLFACEYCSQQFCLDHQLPHHGCTRFSSGGSPGASDGSHATATAESSAGSSAAVAAAGTSGTELIPDGASEAAQPSGSPSGAERAGESREPSRPDVPPGLAAPDGSFRPGTAPVARDAARERRPDRTEPSPTPPGRGMPWERDGETPSDWMRKQSLPGYVLKVGGLSLLFDLAYFGGLAAVVYGWL